MLFSFKFKNKNCVFQCGQTDGLLIQVSDMWYFALCHYLLEFDRHSVLEVLLKVTGVIFRTLNLCTGPGGSNGGSVVILLSDRQWFC